MKLKLRNFFKKFNKFEKSFFIGLFLLNILPVLAPIAKSFGLEFISKPIYFIYSFSCHQFHTRSIHIGGHQCAWCARDMGIWFGFLSAALLYKKGFFGKIKWYHLFIFTLPIALDGGMQTIFTLINLESTGGLSPEVQYVSNNLTRFVTGTIFGSGLSLFTSPFLLGQDKKTEWNFKGFLRKYGMYAIGCLAIYVSLIQIWGFTSPEYKPTNFLDSIPKIQEDDFFARRRNGDCPTTGQEGVLAIDCFF